MNINQDNLMENIYLFYLLTKYKKNDNISKNIFQEKIKKHNSILSLLWHTIIRNSFIQIDGLYIIEYTEKNKELKIIFQEE